MQSMQTNHEDASIALCRVPVSVLCFQTFARLITDDAVAEQKILENKRNVFAKELGTKKGTRPLKPTETLLIVPY